MADIVFHYISDEESDNDDSHHRIDKVEPVAGRSAEVFGQMMGNGMDKILQKLRCEAAYHTDDKREDHHEAALLDVFLSPLHHFCPPFREPVMCFFISQCYVFVYELKISICLGPRG